MTDAARPITKEKSDAAMQFAMDALKKLPKDDREAMEAHITGMLIVFWGALWGTFGTEYARGFIQGQLNGMKGACDTFVPPSTH